MDEPNNMGMRPLQEPTLLHRLVKRSARLEDVRENMNGTLTVRVEWLERFAALVAEECCAIVYGQCGSDNMAQRTAAAIRERFKEP